MTPNNIIVTANTSSLSESLERASLLINDDITAKAEDRELGGLGIYMVREMMDVQKDKR